MRPSALLAAVVLGGCSVPHATYLGDVSTVEEFLRKGGKIEARYDEGGCTRCTLLHFAVLGGRIETSRALVAKRADVNAANGGGATPLHLACYSQVREVVEFLLANGARRSLEVRDALGWTPLLYAVTQPRITRGTVYGVDVVHEMEPSREIVQLLLDAGADIGSATNAGNTALHSAAAGGYPNIVRLLVSRGADPNRKNFDGRTPEDLAVRLAEVARYDFGATLRIESVLSTLRSARAATLPAVAPAPGNASR